MVTSSDDTKALIVVNGQEYRNWTSLRVQRDWGMNPSPFSFVCAEPGQSGQGYNNLRLKPGDRAEVYLAGIKVSTCFITTRVATYDADSHDLIVSGKSVTCDVVDSSVPVKPGTFNGQTMEQATRAVLAPHNVGLVTQNVPAIFSKPFKSLVPQPGETCFEFIQRMGSMRGVDLCDDADGNLVIGRGDPGAQPVAELQEGRNIKAARGMLDDQTAYSRYTVSGQNVGDDGNYPPRDNSATVEDPSIRANRTIMMQAQHPGDKDEMQAAANFVAARNEWPVVNVTLTVFGWKNDNGDLWKPTDNVSVYSPMLFPSESGAMVLGIQSVLFQQDAQGGTTTVLTLVKPSALSIRSDINTPPIPGGANPLDSPAPSGATPDEPDSSTV